MSLKSMAKGALRGIFSILPKTDKKIVFESFSDFCDNSRALFEYLLSIGFDKTHKLVWCVESPEGFGSRASKNVIFTSFRSKKHLLSYLFHIATAKTVFYTHAKPPMVDVRKQTVVCLWHGIPLKKITLAGENPKEAFGFLPSCGEFYDSAMKACFKAADEQLITTGFPRNDLLFENSNSLSKLNIDKRHYKKILLWMPTFRRCSNLGIFDTSEAAKTGLPMFFDTDMLQKLNAELEKRELFLIIKLHPLQDFSGIDIKSLKNIRLLTNKELEKEDIQLYSLVACAEVLLTDYSSIYLDYLLLDRPIGFVIDDIEEYEKNRGFVVDDPLSYMPGEKIKTPTELYVFLDSLLTGKDTYREERARLCNIMHKYKDGNSSKRITERFLKN